MNIAEIESTLISAAKVSMPYLKFVDTYNGELDEAKIIQFALNFPALLVYTKEIQYSHRGWPKLWQDITINVLLCDKNLRGNNASRHGDLVNPGVYKMMEDTFTLLFNETLGMSSILPFDIASESALVNSNKMAIYMATYKTKAAKN